MKKPQGEFWFVPDPSNTWRNKPAYEVEGIIHVIEYSAYQNALEALEKYQQIVLDQELKIVDLEFDGT